ncbi:MULTISPECIES: cadherin repeat domain-containing protein [unclassified Marinobacterium]|uniref:cadherin repeat domain-containing protein n=1 Tax=unclassified Marinobacterium TaxID=2644139 RepID=UPI00156968F8|nr:MULTISPECIES: cadherin repeat domain-containing protein [unclassified Marinobacterium]NRP58279.1 Cadherin domain protein [Marinobacterium sp. xm-d-510]NRP97369.1 Cadherin domain protein [Marinobacterium sp. xm-a-127]
MILDQRQVLIKEDFESASTVYDVAEMRELLARAGASYTLLDGSSLSPIPFVEGRQNGPNLELLLPDGTIVIIREFFADMGTPYSTQTMLASFGPETAVYFPDYVPGLMQSSYGGLSGAIPMFGTAAPAAAAGGISPAMMAMGAAAPAAALLAPTPQGGDINVMTSVGGVGGTVVTTPQPSIKSVSVKLAEDKLSDGEVIGPNSDISATTVTVTSLNLEEGDEIRLRLFRVGDDEAVYTAIQPVDSDGNVTFEIDQSVLQALDDDHYKFVAYLADDESISKKVTFSVDSTPPEFNAPDEFSFAEGIVEYLTHELADTGDTIGIAVAQDLSDVEYSLKESVDASLFTIESDGKLKFKSQPFFDNPLDEGGDNIYKITVEATDSAGNQSSKDIKINITRTPEEPPAGSPTIDTISGLENGFVNIASYAVNGFPTLTGTTPRLEDNQRLEIIVADERDSENSATFVVEETLSDDGGYVWSLDLDDLASQPKTGELTLSDKNSYTAVARIISVADGQEFSVSESSQRTFSVDTTNPTVKLWLDTEEVLTQKLLDTLEESGDPLTVNIKFSERLDGWPDTPDFNYIASLLDFEGLTLVDNENFSVSQDGLKFNVGFTLDPDRQLPGKATVSKDADGNETVLVDPAGNRLLISLFQPEIDTLAPSKLSLDLIEDTGEYDDDSLTNESLRVSGLERDATLNYTHTTSEGIEVVDTVTGGWNQGADGTYYHDLKLPDDEYLVDSISVWQTDTNENIGNKTTLETAFTLDTLGPQISGLTVGNNTQLAVDGELVGEPVNEEPRGLQITVNLGTQPYTDIWLYEDLLNVDENYSRILLSNVNPASSTAILTSAFQEKNGDGTPLGPVVLTFELEVGAKILDPAKPVSLELDNENIPAIFLDFSDAAWLTDTAGNTPEGFPILGDVVPVDFLPGNNLRPSITGFSHTEAVNTDTQFTVTTFGSAGKTVKLTIESIETSTPYAPEDPYATVGTNGEANFNLSDFKLPSSGEFKFTAELFNSKEDATALDTLATAEGKSIIIDELPPSAPDFTAQAGTDISEGGIAQLKEETVYSDALYSLKTSPADETVRFQIDPSNTGKDLFEVFEQKGASYIRLKADFDYETLFSGNVDPSQQVTVGVIATDAAGNSSNSTQLTFDLINLDETPPVFELDDTIDAVNVDFATELAVGDSVYRVAVSDVFETTDRSVLAGVTFALKGEGKDEFSVILNESGEAEISVNLALSKNSYNLSLIAIGADGAESDGLPINLSYNPPDGVPPNFKGVFAQGETDLRGDDYKAEERLLLGEVDENLHGGNLPFWTIFTDDEFANLEVINGTPEGESYFTLEQLASDKQGWRLSLNGNYPLDYETLHGVLNFSIKATDVEGNSSQKIFSLNVKDDGQNPVFQNQNQTITTTEVFADTELNTAVELATQSSGGVIEYSLLATADSSFFDFDSGTGKLTATTDLIYESGITSYDLTLLADYQGETSTADITVNVNDSSNGPDIIRFSWDNDYSPNDPVNPTDKINFKVTFSAPVSAPNLQTGYLVLQFVDETGKTYLQTVPFDGVAQPTDDGTSLVFSVYPPYAVSKGEVFLREIQPNGQLLADLIPKPIKLEYGTDEESDDWVFDTEMPQIESVVISKGAKTLTLQLTHEVEFPQGAVESYVLKKQGDDTTIANYKSFTGTELVFEFNEGAVPETSEEVQLLDLTFLINANRADNLYVTVDQSVRTGSISITAGEFITDSLIVKAYTLDGELLGKTDFNPLNGAIDYVDLMPASYSGPAIINILDGSAELDYLDEFSGELIDYGQTTAGFGLRALINYEDSVALEPISVTPLTELALRLAEANSALDLDAAYDQAMAQLYGLFSLTDTRGQITVTTADGFDTADGISAAENQGLVLAALSTLDNLTGGINSTLDLLDPASGLDQYELDPLIADAIQAVAASENPYVQQIVPELTQVLEQFYDYHPMVIAPLTALEGIEPNADLLDLSAYLADESDFEMVIDGEIQELSTTDDAVAVAQPATPDSILNNTQVVTPAGVDHIDAETDVNIYG